MANTRKIKTFSDFERALKNGYGKGEGKHYKPWLRVQDVPSRGNSGKIQGIKSGREHHTLSEGESCFFYLAEFSDSVIDIREQFPLLPLELSVRIAKTLDIKHPIHPESKDLNVMTFDFMLTRTDGQSTWFEAVSVKPLSDFQLSEDKRQRIAEKLEIERIWCELLGIRYSIFTMTDENKIQSDNIQWLTSSIRRNESFNNQKIYQLALEFIHSGTYLLPQLLFDLEMKFELEAEDVIRLFKELVVKKWIEVDLSASIIETGVVKITKVMKFKDEKYAG